MKRPLSLCTAATLAGLAAGPALAAPLPEAAQTAVLRALDDEYHAEAVYAATLAAFGDVRPFSNIIKAERKHQAALLDLMKTYGMAAPANGYLTGDKPLEALPATLQEVCAVGVAAEIENARLYDEDLLPAVMRYPDITRVFTALRDASINNHLPAFQRCAAGGGQGKGKGNGQSKG
ncbi:MAG: DUF2202 domain-containing protein [Rhizobium sp.]|nr:DUF2202 domain-containing protein [Rhizobium sp.]